ncbi:hypothetical protein Milano_081 [Agrobacterium phage Milano]|nr:hypothetical protein Milano_081 [Agrobacterium phage Milano]
MYRIGKDGNKGWKVVKNATGKNVFFGTKQECEEWIERNGHDGDV